MISILCEFACEQRFESFALSGALEVRSHQLVTTLHEVSSLILVLSRQPGHIADDCKMTIIKVVFEIVL